jgi:DNA (cytosine-5)-methyltransferase 1
MKYLDLKPGELDILAGGPPCQGFSKNVPRKNRFLDQPNNMLVRTFIEYVEALQPKIVLMENVAEMKNGFDQSYTQEILARLGSDGYKVSYQVLNAADYGVPQRRRRAFFLANKGNKHIDFPIPTHSKTNSDDDFLFSVMEPKHYITVWEAIGDLPKAVNGPNKTRLKYDCAPFTSFQKKVRNGNVDVSNHIPRKLTPIQHERLSSIQPGEGIKNLPDHIRPKSGYSGAYGRLTKDMVAPTITRWVFHPGSGRFGHPEEPRVITIREAARIQSFPDDFEFIGTYTQQAGQVGNAVPPILAESIARAILNQFYLDRFTVLDDDERSFINSPIDNLSVLEGNLNAIA